LNLAQALDGDRVIEGLSEATRDLESLDLKVI
jgi:hypothetical protein